jgi:alkylation response protein AidB-like acyl-CoA dehydrogenase
VQNRARTFSHGNSNETRRDPQVLESIGRMSANASAAEAVVVRAAQALQRSYEVHNESAEIIRDAKEVGEIASAEAQIIATRFALDNATALFEGLGASAVDVKHALDRHWRNARTVTSHNPVPFKARIIGDFLVNDVEPPYEWSIGVGKPAEAGQ